MYYLSFIENAARHRRSSDGQYCERACKMASHFVVTVLCSGRGAQRLPPPPTLPPTPSLFIPNGGPSAPLPPPPPHPHPQPHPQWLPSSSLHVGSRYEVRLTETWKYNKILWLENTHEITVFAIMERKHDFCWCGERRHMYEKTHVLHFRNRFWVPLEGMLGSFAGHVEVLRCILKHLAILNLLFAVLSDFWNPTWVKLGVMLKFGTFLGLWNGSWIWWHFWIDFVTFLGPFKPQKVCSRWARIKFLVIFGDDFGSNNELKWTPKEVKIDVETVLKSRCNLKTPHCERTH